MMAVPARVLEDRQLAAIREGARQEAASRRQTRVILDRQQGPKLEIVPAARRRVRLAGVAFAALFLVMLGLTVFQTQLARQQLEIDRVEQSVEIARIRMTELQKSNAVLRSPERVIAEAWKIGLAKGSADDFRVISPEAISAVARAAGTLLDEDADVSVGDPLLEHKQVKAIIAGATS